jgi:hypothetical protein
MVPGPWPEQVLPRASLLGLELQQERLQALPP